MKSGSSQALHKLPSTPVLPVIDLMVLTALAEDLESQAVAFDFLDAFNSMLAARIARIRAGLDGSDIEELRTALLSLQASSTMAGASQLQRTTTDAVTKINRTGTIARGEVASVHQKILLERLTTEAYQFTVAYTFLRAPH